MLYGPLEFKNLVDTPGRIPHILCPSPAGTLKITSYYFYTALLNHYHHI